MLDTNVLVIDKHLKAKAGFFLLLIGIISLAQAAQLLTIGSAEYPTAFITTCAGGALCLEAIPKKNYLLRASQSVLVLVAIALIILF